MAKDKVKAQQRLDAPVTVDSKRGASAKFKKPAKAQADAVKLTFEPRPDWHAADLTTIETPAKLKPIPAEIIEKLHSHAKTLLEAENRAYSEKNASTSSSYKFMSTIMSSGTWSDKVSALTLVVQESPLHTMKPFENLVNLAGKHSRSQALMALGAVKDMLSQGAMLPSDRKLRMFAKQPGLLAGMQGVKAAWGPLDGLPKALNEKHLLVWAYEDWLKQQYFELLKVLERWCNDEVEFAQIRAVTFTWELLKEKPEQEENLLRLLVNKLGDTGKKVASRASYLLLQLQNSHPSMKTIIINTIESDILLRAGQSLHAKYYATITLNQTILHAGDIEVANKLLSVYFSLFVTFLNRQRKQLPNATTETDDSSKKRKRHNHPPKTKPTAAEESNQATQELEDKITAQVLTGINRAFPFSSKDSAALDEHLNTMYRIAHSANFNTSIQALTLIQQISVTQSLATDRFLRTLYESLLDPRLLRSSKQTMYLNLLYRSLKGDVSIRRVKAFVKRLLQILSLHEPAFACGVLYLIIELQETFPGIKAMLAQPELLEEDDDEAFADVPEDDVAVVPETGAAMNADRKALLNGVDGAKRSTAYDGRKRDPEHSNAENTCLWELPPWLHHFHPSITLFARHLLTPPPPSSSIGTSQPTPPPPKPDPTTHTLSHFLDRFAYRNPKKSSLPSNITSTSAEVNLPLRGTSIMQPALANTGAVDHFLTPGLTATGLANTAGVWEPLTAESFWKKKAEDVRADEVFFHKYFSVTGPKKAKSKSTRKKGGEDEDEEVDDELDAERGERKARGGGYGDEDVGDEDEIWKALVGSAPELGAAGDEEEGFSESEVEGYMDSDDEEEGEGVEIGAEEDDEGVDIEGGLELDLDELAEVDGEGDDGEDDEEEADEDGEAFPFGDEGSDVIGTSDEEDEEPPAATVKTKGKKGAELAEQGDERKRKRRKMKGLPTFAAAEDYAAMLDADDDEDN